MLPEKLLQVLSNEGVVAIATQGEDGPHLVNTWHSYVKVKDDNRFIIPVGGMNTTEANIDRNNKVNITVGSREVSGFHVQGTGFSIKGKADFIKQGSDFDEVTSSFPWARAALEVKIDSATQTL